MLWMTTTSEEMKQAIAESGWIDGEVVAVGQLRQGKAPTAFGMATGTALFEVLRPKRSKLLPRQFVLAVTSDRVLAYRALGGGDEDSSVYEVRISPGEEASFPRSSVLISGLEEGPKSKGGTMTIDGKSFPVSRPNLSGDPNTDELFAVLSGG